MNRDRNILYLYNNIFIFQLLKKLLKSLIDNHTPDLLNACKFSIQAQLHTLNGTSTLTCKHSYPCLLEAFFETRLALPKEAVTTPP